MIRKLKKNVKFMHELKVKYKYYIST